MNRHVDFVKISKRDYAIKLFKSFDQEKPEEVLITNDTSLFGDIVEEWLEGGFITDYLKGKL